MQHRSSHPTFDPTKARQGEKTYTARYILVVSTLAAVAAMVIVYLVIL